MSVGIPGLQDLRRKTIRGPINPMDRSTIVSIYPRSLREIKHTIEPGVFEIPAGTFETPSILVVGPSSWWREIDEMQPLLEIPNSSIQIADSIVKDYCNGLLACNMGDSMPGLFYMPGEFSVPVIKQKHMNMLEVAKAKQRKWYENLITLADTMWAVSSGSPRAISDDMRLAAKELGLENKDWMENFQAISMTRCDACGALKNPNYPVCGQCRAVDMSHPKAKELKFAAQG